MQNYSLLIIEDDDFLRTLAYNKLSGIGFTVDSASEGVSGLAKIQSGTYDLVILDLLLPNMDGFHILADLKKHSLLQPEKFIVFSNLGTPEDIKSITEYGIKNYMIKSSFTLDELVIRINAVLSTLNNTEIPTTVEAPNMIEFSASRDESDDIPHSPVTE
jgi:DNA-binding response OmpR family regulator